MTSAACAPTPKHPIAVAVIAEGAGRADEVTGLALHPATLPAPAAPVVDPVPASLAKARAAYAGGEAERCRELLAPLDLPSLLAHEQRGAAARALALDTACAYQGLAQGDATRVATRLATLGLDLPADAVAREAEDLIIAAIEKASATARVELTVSSVAGARISVDGKPPACASPCRLELVPGEHVITALADGFEPVTKTVRVPDSKTLSLEGPPASRQLAATQWRARIGRGLPAVDGQGARLLALALAEPRIAYLTATSGALIVDGALRATGTRDLRELAYDGGLLQRPKVWQRPWFWIVVAGATAVVSGAVIYATYQPERQTMVTF